MEQEAERDEAFVQHPPFFSTLRKERRSKTAQMMDILEVLQEAPSLPTPLMYKTNTSWVSLMDLLGALEKAGCVSCGEYRTRRFWRLTEKGQAALHKYKDSMRIVSEIGEGKE